MNQIILFFRFIKNNIGKISFTALIAVIMVVLLFPFGDLNDFISSKVLEATQNQIYLQFDELKLNPIAVSANMENVVVETPSISNITIKNLSASPSVKALIARQPGGHVIAEGIWGGDLDLKLSPNGSGKSDVAFSAEKLSLKSITQAFNIGLPLAGSLKANIQASVDLSFAEQPDGEITAQIQKFEMSSGPVNIPEMGSLNVPEVKFSVVDVKSKLQAGKLILENVKLGGAADDLSGTIKGDMAITFRNMNGQIVPMIGAYNISIDLVAKPAFKDRASFFLNFIDRFQSADASGTRYKLKLSSSGPGMPPQMLPLQ